jgi:SAM-dependent methyltransferase/GT2 family glycosyltransferase
MEHTDYIVEPIIIKRETPGKLDYVEFDKSYELDNYFAKGAKVKGSPKLTISVLSHRNIESLKECIDSVLKYAAQIDYELVLMDNSSQDDDETYNYMQSVPYKRKTIIKMEDNMGAYFDATRGWRTLWDPAYCTGDYILHLNDDIIITENAAENMIRALDENHDIGMVISMSSASGFGQNPQLQYNNSEEMFEAAREFNVYDPKKWEDRILAGLVMPMFRRELTYCMHSSNPYAFEVCQEERIRQSGYRVVLMGDTWVHHNHDYSRKATYGFMAKTAEGEKIRHNISELSRHLYYGLNSELGATDNTRTLFGFEIELVSLMDISDNGKAVPSILSIDTKAGQGLLDVKNKLRAQGIFECRTTAFTTDVMYYPLLLNIADEVISDRIDFICDRLDGQSFDYIILGKPLNLFRKDPLDLLDTLLGKLNPGGQILFKLRNTASAAYVLKMLGIAESADDDMPIVVSPQELTRHLENNGFTNYVISCIESTSNEVQDTVIDYLLASVPEENNTQNLRIHMQAEDFLFMVSKPASQSHSQHDTESKIKQPKKPVLKKKKEKELKAVDKTGYYAASRFDIMALITHKETEPISVLEIGCSGGGTLATISQLWQNSTVKGIEIVPEIAEMAQSRGLDVICCNIENTHLPYEEESFDYIIAADVLEHLREPEEVLRDLLPYLKKGGSFLCTLPNVQHVTVVNDLMKGKFEYTDAGILDRTHLRFFTLHSTRQLFTNAGLTIECLHGITWATGGPIMTDAINEAIDSKKLFEYQQFLISAKKDT